MFELNIRIARDACEGVGLPRPFVLVGQGGANVISFQNSPAPFIIDAEGVALRSGAVYAWCRTGCCAQIPQRWSSVEAAAHFHGSYIVDADGTVRATEDDAS